MSSALKEATVGQAKHWMNRHIHKNIKVVAWRNPGFISFIPFIFRREHYSLKSTICNLCAQFLHLSLLAPMSDPTWLWLPCIKESADLLLRHLSLLGKKQTYTGRYQVITVFTGHRQVSHVVQFPSFNTACWLQTTTVHYHRWSSKYRLLENLAHCL